MKKYIPILTDETIEYMYNYISADPRNRIGVSNGTVYYIDATGANIGAFAVETTKNFDKIVLGAAVFNVVNTSTSSGCSSCGCSSNNNNNNNNNNG
jgi:hypothetical protein